MELDIGCQRPSETLEGIYGASPGDRLAGNARGKDRPAPPSGRGRPEAQHPSVAGEGIEHGTGSGAVVPFVDFAFEKCRGQAKAAAAVPVEIPERSGQPSKVVTKGPRWQNQRHGRAGPNGQEPVKKPDDRKRCDDPRVKLEPAPVGGCVADHAAEIAMLRRDPAGNLKRGQRIGKVDCKCRGKTDLRGQPVERGLAIIDGDDPRAARRQRMG